LAVAAEFLANESEDWQSRFQSLSGCWDVCVWYIASIHAVNQFVRNWGKADSARTYCGDILPR